MTSKFDHNLIRIAQRDNLLTRILSEHSEAIIKVNDQLMVLKGISLQGSVTLGWHHGRIKDLEKLKADLLESLECDLREKAELTEYLDF